MTAEYAWRLLVIRTSNANRSYRTYSHLYGGSRESAPLRNAKRCHLHGRSGEGCSSLTPLTSQWHNAAESTLGIGGFFLPSSCSPSHSSRVLEPPLGAPR